METVDLSVTFGPVTGDRATLSKSSRGTLEAVYRHPMSHNLAWSDVIALFTEFGTVAHASNSETVFGIGGEHRRIRKPHGKDLTAAEVMEFRHMLSRAGWSPRAASSANGHEQSSSEGEPIGADLLVVLDHHEARLYQLDIRSAEQIDHVIRPYDPHHFLHHLSHKDQSREQGQRAPESFDFYERIMEALAPSSRIVLIGHGKGHSNAAHHLTEYLQLHHKETFQKLAGEVVADLSNITMPHLLELGRRALSPSDTTLPRGPE